MLGGHLLSECARLEITCRCASRSRPVALPRDSAWARWDLCEEISQAALDDLFSGAQAIVHAGAAVPSAREAHTTGALFDANVRSALVLGEWARARSLPLVFISGAIVYASPDRVGIKESDEVGPGGSAGFYGFSKYLGELIFQQFARQGLRLCILRPSSIYGYGLDHTKMISNFLNASMRNEVIELVPPLADAVDLVHASDVARATIQALEHEAVGVYNIASGHMSKVRAVAETCLEIAGTGSIRTIGESDRSPTRRFGLDCSAAQESFSYSPRMSLSRGLADMKAATQLAART